MLIRLRFLPVLSPAGHQDSCYCFLLLIQALLAKCNLFRFLLPKLIKCHTHLGLRPLKPRPCLTAKPHFSLISPITLCSPALLRPLPMPPILWSLTPYWSCGRDVLPAPVRKQRLILLQTLAEPSLSWNVYQETQDLWGFPCHKIQRTLHFYYKFILLTCLIAWFFCYTVNTMRHKATLLFFLYCTLILNLMQLHSTPPVHTCWMNWKG